MDRNPKRKGLMQERSRVWVFTLWEPTEEDLDRLRASKTPISGIIGVESPTESDDRNHLQGYARFKSAKTGSAVKKWIGRNDVHLELPIAGDWENHRYCSKEGNILVQWGEAPAEPAAKGTHPDWEWVADQIQHGKSLLSILDEKPHMTRYVSSIRQYLSEVEVKQQVAWRDVETTYVWGPAGIGKSRAIMEKHGHENVYRITDKKNPWDGYRGEPVVVFEEYRSNFGIENMLNWLDGYPIMLPCRYANRPAAFTRVYLLTNVMLEEQFTGTQETFPETFGAFLRRIDSVVFGCGDSKTWNKWDSMESFANCTGRFDWLELIKSNGIQMGNTLQDLL